MKVKQNKDQDFINASMIAKTPIDLIIGVIATLILIFSIYVNLNLMSQNPPQVLEGVMFYLFPILVTGFLTIPLIVLFIADFCTLETVRTDIDFWRSFKLTWRLQRSMTRKVGNNTNAQSVIARLSNLKRLSSFVWIKKYSSEIVIVIRQDIRHDVNSMVDDVALKEIAEDIASITNETYTGYIDKTVNDKMLIFDHYKKYKVAILT